MKIIVEINVDLKDTHLEIDDLINIIHDEVNRIDGVRYSETISICDEE